MSGSEGVPFDPSFRSYQIVDASSKVQFEEITRLATISLDVPVALILFPDRDRAWFEAEYGLRLIGPPRDLPFCIHAIAHGALLAIPDTRADPRFKDEPCVTGEANVQFYAGLPLVRADRRVIGTLCVIDHRPRELTQHHRDILEILAYQVMSLLELHRVSQELRRQQHHLAEREQELSSLLDSMVEGVVKQDRKGRVTLHNRAAETILGLRSEEIDKGTSPETQWHALRPDGSPFPLTEHPAHLALKGTASRDVEMGFTHLISGQRRWVTINARPLTKPGEERPYAALTTFRDVTDQRGVQERLAQHERLVTTGTLAAGVGHEINNPLAFMMANVGLAIEELQAIGGGSPSERLLEVISLLEQAHKGGERVKRIVRGLKSLARGEGELAVLDPHGSIRNALELAGHELRARATVSLLLDPVPPILADEGRLTQVIVNLIVNAAQAFATANPTTNLVTVRCRHEAEHVIIEVIDNGPGIPAEIRPRIFDPFFTTKPPGVGTGLGLSISHGIVVAMGGRLDCETAVEHGTTFRVSLPIARAAPTEAPIEVTAIGRAMVIDDERTILSSLSRILRREVGTVELIDDPREALAAFERGARFDVVFCDILMPHLTGIELYEAVRQIDAAQVERFVFLSGDMTRPEIQQFLARITNERVEKPFSIPHIRGIARRFIAGR